jgi:hypothetical protein
MGCNCKATEHILQIHKKYGYNTTVPWSTKVAFRTTEVLKITAAFIISLLCAPIFFIVLLIYSFKGKTTINFNKILNKLLRYKHNE